MTVQNRASRRSRITLTIRSTIIASVSAGAVVAWGSSFAAEQSGLSWKKAVPGAQAYLGDDGGGVNTVTVCKTADRYRDWLEGEHPLGCQTFQHDLASVIEVVTYDPVVDRRGDVGLPIAKVHIPSRQFVGYLQLLGLHPFVPPRTVIQFKKIGNESFELFPNQRIGGVDLGNEVRAKVIKYDPSADDNWDLQVTILDGPDAGQSGWMLSSGALSEDGKPMDQFEGAVIDEEQH